MSAVCAAAARDSSTMIATPAKTRTRLHRDCDSDVARAGVHSAAGSAPGSDQAEPPEEIEAGAHDERNRVAQVMENVRGHDAHGEQQAALLGEPPVVAGD